MPPRGVKKGTKRARQYEHIKESVKDRGGSESRAEEIAARTVNKERARSGESRAGIAHLDPGHLLFAPRRSSARAGRDRGGEPATSSTTRRSSWASRGARR